MDFPVLFFIRNPCINITNVFSQINAVSLDSFPRLISNNWFDGFVSFKRLKPLVNITATNQTINLHPLKSQISFWDCIIHFSHPYMVREMTLIKTHYMISYNLYFFLFNSTYKKSFSKENRDALHIKLGFCFLFFPSFNILCMLLVYLFCCKLVLAALEFS